MSLSIGIVGLPNVGKSTLFNALTKKSVPAENYPFCTIDPSVGVVAVPDHRIWQLSEFSKSAKTVPAIIEFVDIAGLVKGASSGEGLGNKFLANIRETDAIAEMVRIFEDDNVIHVDGKISPVNDIGVINLELIMADTETVSKRISNLGKEVKQGKKEAVIELGLMEKLEKALMSGKLASSIEVTDFERPYYKQIHLLTSKPILYVLNKKGGGKNLDEINGGKDERWLDLMKFFKESNSKFVVVDANIENELKEFDGNEKEEMRKALLGKDMTKEEIKDLDGIDNLIRSSYELLNLISYFTTGEDETRAWTIRAGSTAPEAGTAIHTDFKEKFIRAEVIFWKDLLSAGSYGSAREKGLVRTEGKEYIVKDGDVVEFKI